MLLAAVLYESGFPIDDFLADIAQALNADGVRLGGVIQKNPCEHDRSCTEMVLTNLTTGSKVVISQNLGADAQGCRLDAGSLAGVDALLDQTVERANFLILNKFGTAEAEGGGLRGTFARAIELEIPILTAVRPPYVDAWLQFHGGLATDLKPEFDTVLAWCRQAISNDGDR